MSAVPPMPRAGLPSQTATRGRDLDAYLAQFAARYRCRMSSLVQWASSHAEGLLGPLGARWAHVQAVAEQASRIAPAVLPADEREILVAAAWLHDIGYAPALATTGLHPLDGARHLEALGVDRRLCCLVAHHSGATFEARIAEILERYPAGHPVHRAISRSRPALAAAVERTARQLAGVG